MKRNLLITIAILLIATTAIAERGMRVKDEGITPDGSNKWALIIGVDKFDDPNIGTLRYTISDAEALHKTLTTIPNGFPEKNVILMTSNADDESYLPTRSKIIAMLTLYTFPDMG